jgi:alpha-L-rhamnosidase
MWERWNSDTGDVAMNSYNHYAFGAVAGFLYRRLAGIAPAAPGFRKIAVRPVFDPRIGRVKAVYRSCLGPIASELRGDHSGLSRLILDIPANATAEVHLPQQRSWQESGRQLTGRNDVKIAARNRDSLIVEIAAGHYDFRTP